MPGSLLSAGPRDACLVTPVERRNQLNFADILLASTHQQPRQADVSIRFSYDHSRLSSLFSWTYFWPFVHCSALGPIQQHTRHPGAPNLSAKFIQLPYFRLYSHSLMGRSAGQSRSVSFLVRSLIGLGNQCIKSSDSRSS